MTNLFNHSPAAIIFWNSQGCVEEWNPAAEHIFGWSEAEAKAQTSWRFLAPDSAQPDVESVFEKVLHTNQPIDSVNEILTKEGRVITCEWHHIPFGRESEPAIGFMSVAVDVTERKQAEETASLLAAIFQSSDSAISSATLDGTITSWNPAAEKLYGYSAEEAIGQSATILFPPDRLQELQMLMSRLRRGKPVELYETVRLRKDGAPIEITVTYSPLKNGRGELAGVAVISRDISAQRQAQRHLQRQVERLIALRTIDLAITSSSDLRLTLNIFLDQVLAQLGVEGAKVLVLNPHALTLEQAASKGFHRDTLPEYSVSAVNGAEQAVRERQLISVPPAADTHDVAALPVDAAMVGTIGYYACPLIAKGEVKGVLEVYYRGPREFESDWLDFLEALAGQAAIAIDNSTLFDNLQRVNTELRHAYDATISGWSRAMDLRDKETEGHSERVTEMTLRLARAMGMPEEELVHVRRGALLHDIGKMGIPDAILLKPGPLTAEEWRVMRQHPVYAHDMLSPIEFLKPALDIPYCHHEKWDGSGYPRGLKGEQIPLAARIFAAADIWDALRSQRPYRDPWPEEQVREHIRSLTGIHLDPRVVEVFLQLTQTSEANSEFSPAAGSEDATLAEILLLETMPSILIGLDEHDCVAAWNQAAEAALGIPADEVRGRLFRQCPIQWDWNVLSLYMAQCRSSRNLMQLSDFAYTRPDGKRGYVDITLVPVQSGRKRLLILAVDVTERRRLQSQLVEARKMESIGQLAAGIAHEINTPTQYIGDNARFLKDAFTELGTLLQHLQHLTLEQQPGDLSSKEIDQLTSWIKEADAEYLMEEIPRAIQQSLDGVNHVARIVQALKEYAHPGKDEKTSVDLHHLIESTITITRNEWKYVADVATNFEADLPSVPCLSGELSQVIMNLIVNAAHAIAAAQPNGTETKGRIEIQTCRCGEWAEIRISDTGTGIPEAIRSKVFDQFFTTKAVGKGTGQGLAIAHSVVVDKHGGSIHFETEEGVGTTFIICLPLIQT